MSLTGVKICVILGIITAIGLANGYKIGPLVFRVCKHQKDCNFTGGICNTTNWQCNCMKNYVPSSNNHHCVEKINFEDPCIDHNQCAILVTNSTCSNNRCICESGYHHTDNSCWKMAKYNEPCTKSQECSHIENSICTENMICGCAAETVLSTNGAKCLAVAKKIQDECTESIQCTTTFEFSACVDKMCQCEENFHYEYELTRCFPNREVGDECANNYECYQIEDYKSDPPIKSVMCNSNKCTCANNYTLIEHKCVNDGLKLFSSLSLVSLMVAMYCFS
ncbi:hypothetical protein PUN28_002617 [Cardiocondyla obscurior]|uniref:EB domain-containing protein n=1 Tax=Cardiocondyla obscurior TaxID=286306 RepID=A0AAW2GV70_9HYME